MCMQEAHPQNVRTYLEQLAGLEPVSKGLAQALGKKAQESLPAAAKAPIAPKSGMPCIHLAHCTTLRQLRNTISILACVTDCWCLVHLIKVKHARVYLCV